METTTGPLAALHDRGVRGFVTDGGLETDLIFHHGVDLPEFAAFPLLDDPAGRDLLTRYYDGYAAVAAAAGAGLLLESPTWRANTDWAARVGYGPDGTTRANVTAIEFLRALATGYDVPAVLVAGQVGPRGDGYVAGEAQDPEEAREYHAPQVRAFADAGADLVSALTLTTVAEAVGVVLAAREAGVPVSVGFTVETDGRLPDGTPLAEAVAAVDAAAAPEHFVVNCAHPTHVLPALDDGPWVARIAGTRVNASTMSHAELDEAEDLDDGDPAALAADQMTVNVRLPGLRVLGGCCGTDVRHVAAMWGVPAPA
ncbi:homocysteine S-methyltransferase family protein [Phycicoccus sonneratiae]|uniref:Homocysteine S-methyltransferase family protein n=1 Tax=Phycicoccus sonneratiae TaxID=2807628 RepID=A0ABS2CGG4_9MICO|nr:homocysteine S-methyltransferase family protein [Phycicoccus sonneraticus]MBM6398954.1 homocysteine S-methyltransferase family protein [Phycicoccus sonneraticus]